MVKDIIRDEEILSKRAKEWDVRGNQKLSTEIVQALDDTIDEHKDLVYLCSNEVGYEERAIDVRFSDDTYIFMNPIIQKLERPVLNRELDRINGKEYIVPRFNYIEVVYQDCLGSVKMAKLSDDGARWMCQALDTLEGIFAHDIGLEIIPEFDQATEDERLEVIEAYVKSISSKYDELDSELQRADDKTRSQWNAIKFMIAKSEGKVKTDDEKPLSKRKQRFFDKIAKKFKQNENRLKFWRKK